MESFEALGNPRLKSEQFAEPKPGCSVLQSTRSSEFAVGCVWIPGAGTLLTLYMHHRESKWE